MDDEMRVLTSAMARVTRELLGWTVKDMAEFFKVSERAVNRWERGTTPVPFGVSLELDRMYVDQIDIVGDIVDRVKDELEELPKDTPVLIPYYRNQEDYDNAGGDGSYRQVNALARQVLIVLEDLQYPVILVYPDEMDELEGYQPVWH